MVDHLTFMALAMMGFLIWGLVMFSCYSYSYSYSYMVEMTWGCWTRLFTCRWSLIELIYSRECMFLPVRC